MSYGVGHRRGSGPSLLWLWPPRLAAAAPILPLAWELPYAASAALEANKKQKQAGKKKKKKAKMVPNPIRKTKGPQELASTFDQEAFGKGVT